MRTYTTVAETVERCSDDNDVEDVWNIAVESLHIIIHYIQMDEQRD